MKIIVGIAGESAGWASIARSEGFPHERLSSPERISACSAVIAGASTPQSFDQPLRDYTASGGSLLCSPAVFERLGRLTMRSRKVRYLYPEEHSPFERAGLIDLERACRIIPEATLLRTDDGHPAVRAGKFGGGHVVVLPFDAGEAVEDLRARRRSFPAPARRLPHERVSAVARGAVVRLVAASLAWLHHRRNIPYVHLWYYPEGARSIFALRIDTDDGTQQQIRELHARARGLDIPLSWFVHVKAQAQFLGLFSDFRGDETAVHCYEHRRYDDPDTARADLRRAVEMLAGSGANPAGFAAPYGAWTPALDRLIEEFGFEYSSEFSYDYDGLPSSPVVGGVLRPTLQVPVHPVSIGSLRRQGFQAEAMTAYYERVIRRKLALDEPLLFYHHPRDGNLDVLAALATAARRGHIVTMTMLEAARWWKSRDAGRLDVRLEEETLGASPAGAFLRIWMPDGRVAVAPAAPRLDLAAMPWKLPEPVDAFDGDMRRARRVNPWIAVNAVEDRLTRLLRRSRP